MASVTGVKKLRRKLKALLAKAKLDSEKDVIVGYTAQYAIFVHENLEAQHTNGEAKYLENPARELADELGNTVTAAVKRNIPFIQALFIAGLRLQRASQQRVPVDTGNLRSSAFTRIE